MTETRQKPSTPVAVASATPNPGTRRALLAGVTAGAALAALPPAQAATLAADPAAALQVATKQYADASVAGLSVKWFGAKGDGTTDDTAAIQAALDAAAASATIRAIFLPPTLTGYRCTATLNLRAGITLRGTGCVPTIANGTHGIGSWLYFNHTGIGIRVTQAIGAPAGTTTSGVELRGIGTIRDQPADGAGWSPNDNDFDISINTGDVLINDIMLLNPTKGIKIRQPGNGYGRITIQHLRGDPYQVGIDVDQTYDIGNWNDIHFWPFWIDSPNTKAYKLANLEAFIFGRLDGLHASNIFTICAKNSIRYRQTTAGVSLRHQWANVYFDLCNNGVVFDRSIDGSKGSVNPSFANLVVFGSGGRTGYAVDFQGVGCELYVANGHLVNFPAQAVNVGGTGNIYRHSLGVFRDFDTLARGAAAVQVGAGNGASLDSQIRYDFPASHVLVDGAGQWSVATTKDQGGRLLVPYLAVDETAYLHVSRTNVNLNFDTNDYASYDRAANKWMFYIGGVAKMSLDSSGNLKVSGTITSSAVL